MASWGRGLRAKSLWGLLLAGLLALLPAGLLAWQVLEGVRNHFGEAFARNTTLLHREKILAPLSRELALSQRLADSVLTREWLLDETNPELQDRFFREAEGYRRDFRNNGYFLISALSRNYYINDPERDDAQTPRYQLQPDAPDDAWFFNVMANTEHYNLNVNPDARLRVTRVWINVIVRDGERKIGLAGTGLELDEFLNEFIDQRESGVTPIILDASGAIQAHPDRSRIAYGATAGAAAATFLSQLERDEERQQLSAALDQAAAHPGEVRSVWVHLDGRPQLIALSYIDELKWHVMSVVDLKTAQVFASGWLGGALVAVLLLFGLLLLGFAYAIEKLVLQPLRALRVSAEAISRGRYEVALPPSSQDEIGDLSRSFGLMAEQVRTHTQELENRVRARTEELENANQVMATAQRQIKDSIDYASLIQRAILPDRQLTELLGEHHFVLWRPRDVVGGDFYVFRAEDTRYLVGVVDCAGHGVPGALMTMLARAAIDHAMNAVGLHSPAAILAHTDRAMRAMLQDCELPRAIATNLDAGFVAFDRANQNLVFAGAKISLYWSDGERVEEIKGGRRAIGDRRPGSYQDVQVALRPGASYYLVTDGYLDQAGGEFGYSFGNTRFADLLRHNALLPAHQQGPALEAALESYRGQLPQRDDITLVSFRFD